MADEHQSKSDAARKEEEMLAFWEKKNIFQKTLAKPSPRGNFSFYDGPPFATGLPHYGHILSGTIKDAIPRYKTMQGYHVRRRWGWDCHGLPVENEVEKELSLKTKKDIEAYGIERFNARAEESVLRYAGEWREIIPRTGRFVDMERDYRTMDWSYTESVWWVFHTLYEKGLIYEGFKSMHLCPRCETTLSNFEVSQGYAETTDLAVTVRLPLLGEPDTALLVWTTTPWTLPGNAAAAVNKTIVYGKFEIKNPKSDAERGRFIVARALAKKVFEGREYRMVSELRGDELSGVRYIPPFDYYAKGELLGKEHAWKVYTADFVSTDEGTGIVHIAPAFGEDDMALANENRIPMFQHVGPDGRFKCPVRDFKGLPVKPKDDPQATDILIIKYLAEKGLLFAREKVKHTYPFCWRCDTPLLNYAAASWFVKVADIKDQIIALNKKINWIPSDIRDGRFGNWLRGARDWAISRSRFWGAPIPVWRCFECKAETVIGSVRDLKEKAKSSGNTYVVMRHGEAENNVLGVMNSVERDKYGLSEKGEKEVALTARKINALDLIITSPIRRARETADIIARELGLPQSAIVTDERLRENDMGEFEGKAHEDYHRFFKTFEGRFTKTPQNGENFMQVKMRVTELLYALEKKYRNMKIILVSHSGPVWMLTAGSLGATNAEAIKLYGAPKNSENFIRTGEARELPFVPLPHNKNYELDLHRPYVDDIVFPCACGGEMKRAAEVFDCWFESGSMPYGQLHYPFENKEVFKKNFPADFIAEGLDQTRGWFYSLLVLSAGLFGKSAYKNVITNGLVLAEDGRKMSKRLKNYPDPLYILNRYGADALRYYLLSSPVVRGDNLNFSETGVREVQNKVLTRLRNVCAFYEMYAEAGIGEERGTPPSENVLDRWINARLKETVTIMSYRTDRYEIDRAVRPIARFVDDLSTWYLRRSRDRFRGEDAGDKTAALATTRQVLHRFSRATAPFLPFAAEEVFQKVKRADDPESVHLAAWPEREMNIPAWPNPMALFHRIFGTHADISLLADMEEVRAVVSSALEARTKAGIKVRQPLAALKVGNSESKIKSNDQLVRLIQDEVNVKEVVFGADIKSDVDIDTAITPELEREGRYRDLVRAVQDLRKKENLIPSDEASLIVSTNDAGKAFLSEVEEDLKKAATLKAVAFKDNVLGEEVTLGNLSFKLDLEV